VAVVEQVLLFHFHEPFRLHPDRERFLWDEVNREVFLAHLDQIYFPVVKLLGDFLDRYPSFRFALGMSGTFLEQAEMYGRDLLTVCIELCQRGFREGRVEFVDETYYHSTVGLFRDADKREFRDQVALHRERIRTLFGLYPLTFAQTDVMVTEEIIRVVGEMNYQAFLVDDGRCPRHKCRLPGYELPIVPLVQVCLETKKEEKETADERVISYYELSKMRDVSVWKQFLETLLENRAGNSFLTPSDITNLSSPTPCPEWVLPIMPLTDYFDPVQYALFREIEEMELEAKRAGEALLNRWRYLTMVDHLIYLADQRVAEHPYGGSVAHASYVLTHKINRLKIDLLRFEILRRPVRTAVLLISPETGRLPDGMGQLARFISGKSGGQGEVVAALCKGLVDRGIDVHLATLNLKKRFQKENQIGEAEWRAIRYTVPPERIHLISSPLFADKMNAYEGDVLATAMEFQRQLVNYVIKDVRARHEGRLIIHSHDWMAGGIITAYARARDLPVLHTVHNVFTAYIPFPMMSGIDINSLYERLFVAFHEGTLTVDCQATAIKNANLINFVGQRFLEEVVNDYFLDRPIIPPGVRQEVKAKYAAHAVHAIINAPSPSMYPENCEHLVRKYGPDDDILAAKRENLLAFQRLTGLTEDPEAILFSGLPVSIPCRKVLNCLRLSPNHFVSSTQGYRLLLLGMEWEPIRPIRKFWGGSLMPPEVRSPTILIQNDYPCWVMERQTMSSEPPYMSLVDRLTRLLISLVRRRLTGIREDITTRLRNCN